MRHKVPVLARSIEWKQLDENSWTEMKNSGNSRNVHNSRRYEKSLWSTFGETGGPPPLPGGRPWLGINVVMYYQLICIPTWGIVVAVECLAFCSLYHSVRGIGRRQETAIYRRVACNTIQYNTKQYKIIQYTVRPRCMYRQSQPYTVGPPAIQ